MSIFGVPIQALASQLLLGIVNGSFYAILSLGLSIIFGMLHIANFVHGAQYMMGAFVAWAALNYFGISYWWSLALAPLIMFVAGIVIEVVFLRRLYDLDHFYGLLMTFGLLLMIESLFRKGFGSTGMAYPNPLPGGINLGFMFMPYYRAWVVLASVILCLGTWFVIEKQMTYGEFIAFILLSNIFLSPINKINAVIEVYPKGVAGFKRYVELLETEPDVVNREGAIEVNHVNGMIEYNDVSFSYKGEEETLFNIHLRIQPGETIALVGPSGAGKTTLCSLLPRFYDVTGGQIKIDGKDIRDITLSSLRSHIGIVQQDVFLFDGTIRENIAYGHLYATDDEIWEAARKAQLEDVIRAQKDGIDTLIGERGVKLSGGQKQRLSIARMFLKNPSILILDEATSALDTETEQAIQQALTDLSKGRTTLVIAHRLATIKDADRIVVVTKEGIVEEGSHQTLLKNKGMYSKLHAAQFGA